MKNCIVIYNKNSGRGITLAKKDQIASYIIKKGYSPIFVDLIEVSNKFLKRMITNNDVGLIFSAGGDGTFNTLVNKVIKYKSDVPISHIPLGSANDIGNNFDLKKIEEIMSGDIIEIDIPKINNTNFSYVAALGTIPALSYNTPRCTKKQLGKLAYFTNGISRLVKNGLEKYNTMYRIDNKTYETETNEIIVSNTNCIGGFKNIFTSAKFNDNLFEVTFIKNGNIGEVVDILSSRFLLGKSVGNLPNVNHFSVDNLEIVIENSKKNKWTIDGEEYKENDEKCVFQLKNRVKMLLPQKTIKRIRG